ncbi:hypothetical protein EG327_005010 [Venturia inaequalis]|uniref:CCZ1/INTU/HSP4 first Longin domain-containing protein n=1 Tax=Venturia inaequalis TaxID=5025 RepID=A0A8H3V9I2_VENIN|nr:hypothetical protein EG327_005010 [Venturia inaequalis]
MSTLEGKVVPAQLSFLAIYNPSLGITDETFEDQILFWWSKTSRDRKRSASNPRLAKQTQEQENEKLRQIGLAQGMVDFAKSFANGKPVDQIETEKSRIVMHELEPGWWIIASIDLTRLPLSLSPTNKSSKSDANNDTPAYEYSSREVGPPHLLLEQLVRGHRTFLLHNGSSLTDLYTRLTRQKFCALLDRFWNRFPQTWDVLLHGNPAVAQFGGLKLAAGGELGIGVGEEEWGSGEREVLEDFARRTDGLIDLMVARFGEPGTDPAKNSKSGATGRSMRHTDRDREPWHGAGHFPQATDGVVFSGTGVISRSSLRDISQWVQTIHTYGEQAFGVRESPTSDRRKRKRAAKSPSTTRTADRTKEVAPISSSKLATRNKDDSPPGIPPPIVSAVERSLERATSSANIAKQDATREQDMQHIDPEPAVDKDAEYQERLKTQIRLEESGHFLIGLTGELLDEDSVQEDDETEGPNNRILLRTLHVEVEKKPPALEYDSHDTGTPDLNQDPALQKRAKRSRLRVVVYVHRPFIYTFLFTAQTSSLSMPAFYRNMHNFFSPLHKTLSASTSPSKVAGRLAAASQTYTTSSPGDVQSAEDQQPIFALVYDPRSFSIHSSIPNIPAPGSLAAGGLSSIAEGIPEGWTRIEAINVHSAILELVKETRPATNSGGGGERELERSVKTGRGWWVVWMRMDDDLPQQVENTPSLAIADGSNTPTLKNQMTRGGDYFGSLRGSESSHVMTFADSREAILVRRARDAVPAAQKKSGGIWGFSGVGNGKDAGAGWGPARLAEGVGIDARKDTSALNLIIKDIVINVSIHILFSCTTSIAAAQSSPAEMLEARATLHIKYLSLAISEEQMRIKETNRTASLLVEMSRANAPQHFRP